MRKVRKAKLCCVLILAILVSLPNSSVAKELTSISNLQPPPWPLKPLTSDERKARLQFVMKTQNYHVAKPSDLMTQEDCEGLLGNLKDSAKVHILEPDIIAESRDDKKVPDNLIRKCSSVEIDRVWYSWAKGPLSSGVDSTFDQLSLEQKDQAADYFFLKAGHIEFYDVSRFFDGKRTWATFAEEGRIICNKPEDEACKGKEGYQLSNGVIVGPIIDAQSCEQHLPPKVKAYERLRVGNRNPYAFQETPNFFAYAEIDNVLYRLGLNTAIPWEEFHQLISGGSTTFIAEPASSKVDGLCVYETMPSNKGE